MEHLKNTVHEDKASSSSEAAEGSSPQSLSASSSSSSSATRAVCSPAVKITQSIAIAIENLAKLQQEKGHAHALKFLDLHNSQFEETVEQSELSRAITMCTKLKELDLSGNKLYGCIIGVQQQPPPQQQYGEQQQQGPIYSINGPLLHTLAELESLNCTCTSIPLPIVTECVLPSCANSLSKSFYLTNYSIGDGMAVGRALSHLVRVTYLNLDSVQFVNSTSMAYVAYGIGHMKELQHLSLMACNLYANNIETLFTNLANCKNLKILNMWNNNMSSYVAAKIDTFLSQLKNLEELNLSKNDLDIASAEILIKAMAQFERLSLLNLANNNKLGLKAASNLCQQYLTKITRSSFKLMADYDPLDDLDFDDDL